LLNHKVLIFISILKFFQVNLKWVFYFSRKNYMGFNPLMIFYVWIKLFDNWVSLLMK
jgi:hypothetical protein